MSLLNFYHNNDSSGSQAVRAPISTPQNSVFELAEYNQAQMSMSYNPSEGLHHGRDTSRIYGHQDNLAVIRAASRQVLLASENIPYFELLQENMRLKGELGAKMDLITHLMEKDKLGITNQLIGPTSTANYTLPSTLVIPNPPLPCDQADFEDVPYWTREEWTAYWARQAAKGKPPSKLGFLCEKDGRTVSEGRLNVMTKRAHELWAELYRERHNPPTWSNKNRSAAEFFSNSMRLEFEEFRYCGNDWKLKAFATVRYPDFTKKPSLARLARRNPSLRTDTKRKPTDQGSHPENSKPRPPKKRKTPLSIEIHDVDGGSDVDVEFVPIMPSSSNGLAAGGPGKDIFVEAATVPKPADASPSTPGTLSVSGGRESPAITTTSALHQSTPPVEVIPVEAPHASLGPQLASNTTELQGGVVAPSRRTRAGQNLNVLSNMTIPRPAQDLQVPAVTNPPSSSSTAASLAISSTKRGEKLMKATESMTARNLFAVEYLKNHSPTVAEFKAIYDALDKVTMKKYEALSRQKKAEAN